MGWGRRVLSKIPFAKRLGIKPEIVIAPPPKPKVVALKKPKRTRLAPKEFKFKFERQKVSEADKAFGVKAYKLNAVSMRNLLDETRQYDDLLEAFKKGLFSNKNFIGAYKNLGIGDKKRAFNAYLEAEGDILDIKYVKPQDIIELVKVMENLNVRRKKTEKGERKLTTPEMVGLFGRVMGETASRIMLKNLERQRIEAQRRKRAKGEE